MIDSGVFKIFIRGFELSIDLVDSLYQLQVRF